MGSDDTKTHNDNTGNNCGDVKQDIDFGGCDNGVMGGDTDTDTDIITYTNNGVLCPRDTEFTRMPFSLSGSPMTFTRMVNTVLNGLLSENIFVYMDDIVTATESMGQHLEVLKEVLRRLRDLEKSDDRLNRDDLCRAERCGICKRPATPLQSQSVINGTNLEDPQGLDTRYVSLSSGAEVQWQMMTLPLKDHELQNATPGEEVLLDLPEEDEVWVALWNKLGREVGTELSLFHELEKHRHLNINASKDWSIICINKVRILYGNDVHPVYNKSLNGRRLQMKSDGEIHFQVFPVPLKSTDAAPPPATFLIAIAVVATSVVILGTFFGCRFFWKKRNAGPTEGATAAMSTINNPSSADEGLVPTAEHFGESSFHVSENMLYGFVIRR
ncbi:uncharacterized protein LOC135209793 [Macrobrachium nipponense]|uniref:uncharacterized protein LOC135209793 n=1 Tax=Macrobrachium nipponense TaxID=159736 RepID=UPI0030C844A7